MKQSILFLHSISGWDTISCFFNVGKINHFKLLEKYPDLQQVISIFNNPNSAQDEILKSGENYVLKLYGAPDEEHSINNYHYISCFKTKFNLAGLPSTQESLKQHLFRTFHQVQTWYGREINAEHWGWKLTNNGLQPIFTNDEPAPKSILENISCGCLKNCGSACGCRKQGMKCSCKTCCSESCSNSLIEVQPDDQFSD